MMRLRACWLWCWPLVATAGGALPPPLPTTRLPMSCELRPGQPAVLKARAHGIEGVSLSTRWQGRDAPAFGEAAGAELVGEVVLAACVQRTLVYALNYGPPYLKGVAWRINPRTRQAERIDFAEKALPAYLDVGPRGMTLVFPNEGGEHDLRYTLYRSGSAEAEPSDTLPTTGRAVRRYRLPTR